MTTNTQKTFMDHVEFDRNLKVGDTVRVAWGYGSGFQASGVGKVVKLNSKSLWVELTEDAGGRHNYSLNGVQWPKGYVLKGIPRCVLTNDQWQWWADGSVRNGVESL